jgi:magnesium-transporting ATPase (P-type)
MDTLGAIALASEPPVLGDHQHDENGEDDHDHNDISRRKEEKIIKEVMWRNVLVQAAYQILVLIVLLYSMPFWFPNSAYNLILTNFYGGGEDSERMLRHYTVVFNTFIIMNLFY